MSHLYETVIGWYVILVDVEDCYGGPEEGGWYYRGGTVLKKIHSSSLLNAYGKADFLGITRRIQIEKCVNSHDNDGWEWETMGKDIKIGQFYPISCPYYS